MSSAHLSLKGLIGAVLMIVALTPIIPMALGLSNEVAILLAIVLFVIGLFIVWNEYWYEPKK